DTAVVQAVNNSLLAANLDPTQANHTPPNPTPLACPGAVPPGTCAQASAGQFMLCRNIQLNQNGTSTPVCGVIVSFTYPYQFVLPFTSLNNQRIQLKTQVEMRGED